MVSRRPNISAARSRNAALCEGAWRSRAYDDLLSRCAKRQHPRKNCCNHSASNHLIHCLHVKRRDTAPCGVATHSQMIKEEGLEADGYLTKPIDLAAFVAAATSHPRFWLELVHSPA